MASRVLLSILCAFLLHWCHADDARPLSLITWDSPALMRLRNLVAENNTRLPQSTSTALQHLYAQTDADLADLANSGAPTVTHKTILPPHATSHDYVSLVPYAFSCKDVPKGCHGYAFAPLDLSKCNNSTGLPWQICDGQLNLIARNSMTDRPALENMSHLAIRLALTAYVFRDPRRAAAAAEVLDVWFVSSATRMRPSVRFAQGIPGVTDGKHSGCIDLSLFPRGLADAILLLEQTPEAETFWRAPQRNATRAWCKDMADHLINDHESSKEVNMRNNHGIYYDATVASLLLVANGGASSAVLRRMSEESCEGFMWCFRGRMADQVNEEGQQVHEMVRNGFEHYVWYTMLAHAHLFMIANAAHAKISAANSALRKAASWTMPRLRNLTEDPKAGWVVYAPQALRIVARETGEEQFEKAACEVLTKMSAVTTSYDGAMWHKQRVGVDVFNIVFPPRGSLKDCEAWQRFPRLPGPSARLPGPSERARKTRTMLGKEADKILAESRAATFGGVVAIGLAALLVVNSIDRRRSAWARPGKMLHPARDR